MILAYDPTEPTGRILAARAAMNKLGPVSSDYFFGGNSNTITSDTALTTKLYNALSGRISFFVQNESNPQPGHDATDMTTRIMLVYGF